mgnify:CR=1 FL=1
MILVQKKGAIVTDQTRVVSSLIALRDKYRRYAIRTQERGALAMEKHAGKDAPRPNLSGFMKRRDYYITAAEAVDALIPKTSVVDVPTEESNNG